MFIINYCCCCCCCNKTIQFTKQSAEYNDGGEGAVKIKKQTEVKSA